MTRPAHAKDFRGGAKCIPARDTFLLKYQSDWVLDMSLLKMMEKTRRAGITFGTSYGYVREHCQLDSNLDTFFSSRDELTAREFILYCKGFAGALDKGAQDLGERIIDDRGTNAHVLQFTSGKRIYALSSNPDAFAGKGGNAGVDELALRKDPRQVVGISQATIDWGGRWAGISTHRGTANWFNQTIQEIKHKQNPKGYSLHTVTLERALAEGFLWKLQTKLRESDPRMAMDETAYFNFIRSRSPDQETFNQEYMCIPDDDASAFISYDLIDGCKYKPGEPWEKTLKELAESPNALYAGIDIGRKHDLTSVWCEREDHGHPFLPPADRRQEPAVLRAGGDHLPDPRAAEPAPRLLRQQPASACRWPSARSNASAPARGRGGDIHRSGEGGAGLTPSAPRARTGRSGCPTGPR